MRVLIDYRAALASPSGVGEYARQLVAGLAHRRQTAGPTIATTIFSSSWKDRLSVPAGLTGIGAVDLHIPVSVLNFAWHRLGWPKIEALTDASFDVVHSLHPLLLPARSAAQVVTVYDLDFLKHPERTHGEIRRDYPPLARAHAQRADHVLVSSRFTAGEVERLLGVPMSRITVCYPGAPDWSPRASAPGNGYILFVGTLEPRKNIGTLLDAYERLIDAASRDGKRLPDLVLAGRATPAAASWLDRMARAPLVGRVRHMGYVQPAELKILYEGAALLVQPSFEEGFGLPPLEAMTLGVPVVAANRGSVPEVVEDAGVLIDPEDAQAMAAAIRRMIDDCALARRCASAGPLRSRAFARDAMAERAVNGYTLALENRARRRRLT
jgi:glycosyltransferase involved in cell wall biosynthesis